MRHKKGFTLIELLVVIAIIALLLSILMPSLQVAKRIAHGIVCSNNNKTQAMAVNLFAQDNDGYVPNPGPTNINNWNSDIRRNGWVTIPHGENKQNIPMRDATLEDRIRGIEGGTLYKYVENHKAYNCRGDQRTKGQFGNYLSYAMPGCLLPSSNDTNRYITKLSQISRPSEKYIILEESDPRAYVQGSWSFGTKEHGRDGWWDGLAIWHNDASTFGFADGHAESRKWRDEYTKIRAGWDLADLQARGGAYGYIAWPHADYGGVRNDLDWMQAHWPFAR